MINFSPISMPFPSSYISQDEIDILLEMDRIDGIKHKLTEQERSFSDAALHKSELF